MAKKKKSGDGVSTPVPTDEDLFVRFLEGKTSAFEELVRRYKDRAYWLAWQMLRHREESLDLAQEAFAKAFVAARTFDVNQKFSTWFFRIVTNLCIDTLRRKRVRRTVTSDDPPDAVFEGPGPGDQAEYRELKAKVNRVLGLLDRNHRAILCLRDIQGHSCLDIADILRCTHATARWRLHRARIKFKEAWEKEYGAFEEKL